MRSLIDSLAIGLHPSNALTRELVERVRDLVIASDEEPANILYGVPSCRPSPASVSINREGTPRALEDNGADRGIIFVAPVSQPERQFELVKTEWVSKGLFFGASDERGPARRSERWQRPVHHPHGRSAAA